jgi:hypothetical protein
LYWWSMDGIEPLASKDLIYSQAATPVSSYLHRP